LTLVAPWIGGASEDARSSFHSHVHRLYKDAPSEYLAILSSAWKGLGPAQIRDQILQMYALDSDAELTKTRDDSAIRGLYALEAAKRGPISKEVWVQLTAQNKDPAAFFRVAMRILRKDALRALWTESISLVRDLGASGDSEIDLRFLATTGSRDPAIGAEIVDLFLYLFNKGNAEALLANKYVVPCLGQRSLQKEEKHSLAEAMARATRRTEDQIARASLQEEAGHLGLKGYAYRRHWRDV
jgi:hypothetical protein